MKRKSFLDTLAARQWAPFPINDKPRFQLAVIVYDHDYPHLKGCTLWVQLEKPALYPVVGRKKRMRLVNSNLSMRDDWGKTAGWNPRQIERLSTVTEGVDVFQSLVPAVPFETWTNPEWKGVLPEWKRPYLPVTVRGAMAARASSPIRKPPKRNAPGKSTNQAQTKTRSLKSAAPGKGMSSMMNEDD